MVVCVAPRGMNVQAGLLNSGHVNSSGFGRSSGVAAMLVARLPAFDKPALF